MKKKVRLNFDSGRKFNEKDIKEFEEKYKIDLPLDYRNFLMEYGETTPEKNLFSYKSLHAQDNFEVRYFHHINNLYFDREEFPENIIAIASTSGDCYVVISVSGDDKGKIYFWEKDYLNEEKPDYSNLFLLANNFEEFLNSFDYPYDSQFIEYCEKGNIKEARKIIEKGLDVNSNDSVGYPIIRHVISSFSVVKNLDELYDLIKIMVDKGLDIKNTGVLTMLSGEYETCLRFVKLFLENGSDINELYGSNKDWLLTPLINACMNNSVEMVKFILEKGADPYKKGLQDKTPRDFILFRIDQYKNQGMWNEEMYNNFIKIHDILLEAEKNWKG